MIKTDIQIRFSDIDMLGHVNNIVLQNYYDLGKMQYFTDVLGFPPLWRDEAFIVVNNSNDYFEEVRVTDAVYVTTRIEKIGTKSITFVQEIVSSVTHKVKSRSRSILVGFDLNKRVGIEVRPELKLMIEEHEGEQRA
ncbi:MAG: acyl-CoA thioesterase [Rikenellaceae bacterium]